MSQTKIRTRIERRGDGKFKQVADIRKEDWASLFRYEPRSPTGLMYLPRVPEVFRASRNPDEHCAAWNREFAGKNVMMTPVVVMGRSYPVRVIHEALGTLALMPPNPPSRVKPRVKEGPPKERKAFEDDVLRALFDWKDGVLVWRARDRMAWEMLGYAGKDAADIAAWNARWGDVPVGGIGKGYVLVTHVGSSKRGTGMGRHESRTLIRGLNFIEQAQAGNDPRDDPGLTPRERSAITRAMQVAMGDPEAAMAARARFEAAMDHRERTTCVRLRHIAEALSVPADMLSLRKRTYIRSGVGKEERLAMFAAAFPILWKWGYVERAFSAAGSTRLMADGMWYQVPRFIPVTEEGWREVQRIGLVDEVPTPARQRQWNTTHAGQSFTGGKVAVGRFRITFDEVMMVAPETGRPPFRIDERMWEDAGPGPEEWQRWMRLRPMGF